MKKRLRSDLLRATLAVLALATSACVRPDPPSVGMSKIEASLVFGFSEPEEREPTPIEQIAAPFVAAAPVEAPEEPLGFALPDDFGFERPLPAPAPRPACATAPEGAVAERVAGQRVTADPLQGSGRWRVNGFLSIPTPEGDKQRQDLRQSFRDRAFRNFQRQSDNVYTFEMVEKGARDQVFVTTFRVNTEPVSRNPSDGVGVVVTPGVGEVERGITLEKTETVDVRTGQVINSFAPTTGLLLLPIPVVPGEKFQSAAVDPRSGETIVHESTVRENRRYDACGEVVDGWLVESVRSVTAAQGVLPNRDDESDQFQGLGQYNYNLAFAPQYGGIPIFEQLAVDDPEACASCPLSIEFTIGNLTLEPLAG